MKEYNFIEGYIKIYAATDFQREVAEKMLKATMQAISIQLQSQHKSNRVEYVGEISHKEKEEIKNIFKQHNPQAK